MDNTCNGWKNYQTWNCALWLSNDEKLVDICASYKRNFFKEDVSWQNFIKWTGLKTMKTPDGVSWSDPEIDGAALIDMIFED